MDNQIFEQVDDYISALLAPEDEALTNITRTIESEAIPNMSITPAQGKFLQVLALACNARKILELGTLAGYSTVWLARILPDDGKVITLEYDERYAAIARKNIDNAGVGSKVDIRIGKALDILPKLAEDKEGPFDMIFIDADKPPYTEYFEWAIRLGRPGTIIVADNVIRNGQVLDPNHPDDRVQGVRRLNQMLSNCTEVTATILQTVGAKEYDGMVVAVINKQEDIKQKC